MFEQGPVLSVVVRNLVVARAAAGAYDPNETAYKAIQDCRRVARERLGKGRLNSAEADAVDALVIATRVAAHESGSAFVKGQTMVIEPRALAPVQPTIIQQQDDGTMKLILAALLRLERMMLALVAVIVNRATGRATGEPILDAPSVPALGEGYKIQQIHALPVRSTVRYEGN